MPKKKKRNPSEHKNSEHSEKNPETVRDVQPEAEGFDSFDIGELRAMLPPELANLDDEDLAKLWDQFQTQGLDEMPSDDDDALLFDDDDEGDGYDEMDAEFEELARQKAPPGYFAALDELDEIADIDDPQECNQRLLAILERCPQCGDAERVSRPAADQNPRPVRHPRQLCRAQ